jgi:hypothetical protein
LICTERHSPKDSCSITINSGGELNLNIIVGSNVLKTHVKKGESQISFPV